MKVLWVGDAVVSTGFSRCTHVVCDELHNRGHQVQVLAIGYHGDPHQYPYEIFPCYQPQDDGHDPYGVTRLPTLVFRYEPDIVVLLNDPWNVEGYFDHLDKRLPEDHVRPPIVGWLAVDSMNHDGKPLNRLSHVVTWTEFASNELTKGGCNVPSSIVPLGVDSDKFHHIDKAESRKSTCPKDLPSSAFVVGSVGRNQPRKRLDLTIRYFANWIKSRNIMDAYLFLHLAPTGDMGHDIAKISRFYGVQTRVILSINSPGLGSTHDHLLKVYNSFDVYLSTSQGEGWGLPAIEAMSCEVPAILPNAGGYGSWVDPSSAILIPCTSTAITAPVNGAGYTVGSIPREQETISALDQVYRDNELRLQLSLSGRSLAESLPWSSTATLMSDLLEQVHQDERHADKEHETSSSPSP